MSDTQTAETTSKNDYNAPPPPPPPRRKRLASTSTTNRPNNYEVIFMMIVSAFTIISIMLNMVLHESTGNINDNPIKHHPVLKRHRNHNRNSSKKMMIQKSSANIEVLRSDLQENVEETVSNLDNHNVGTDIAMKSTSSQEGSSNEEHSLGGLKCESYGGPDDEIAVKEMVYWSDIPSDSKFVSPFKLNNNAKGGTTQYMTFEPDGGGWNNIRMAMETVVAMAFATGRTLVMPPAQRMYLLRKDRGKQTTDFSFADFFHLETLSKEHDGIDIISTEEFLIREALSGNLRNKTTGEVAFPPGNRTNWDGQDLKPFKEYMRSVIYTPLWSPGSCLVAFPASGEPHDVEHLQQMLNTIHTEGGTKYRSFENNPTPVDAPPIDRMREALAGRSELCIYDEEMQNAPVIHFMCYHKMRVRLLTHFYSFLFFEDWRHQLWIHRFVRDHLRYLDELQCAAARVVTELRSIAMREVENNPDGHFDAYHIRRGDFQFKETRLEANELYSRSKEYVPEGSVLYIATDERKKDFFKIFGEHYKVYYFYMIHHLYS
mmetsp:Transcript_775/g.1319  ORF Transcript_775/g.1319 Transcript_775/m.1319 type:complete len:544 (+) Transcript_775:274-1905(+)